MKSVSYVFTIAISFVALIFGRFGKSVVDDAVNHQLEVVGFVEGLKCIWMQSSQHKLGASLDTYEKSNTTPKNK